VLSQTATAPTAGLRAERPGVTTAPGGNSRAGLRMVADLASGMPLPASQAILNPLSDAAIFLVLTVAQVDEQRVHDALGDISGLVRTVGFRVPSSVLTCITSIGSDAWGRLFDGPRPKELHVLPEFHGAVHSSVSTPGDILFHIRGQGMDVCFEHASLLVDRFGGPAAVVDEVHGFKSFDERDLLGFVDGTENPTGALAVSNVIMRHDEPQFVGGSYVVCRSTCTTSRPGTRSPSSSRSTPSAEARLTTSRWPRSSSRPTPTPC
jgi:hypothetical protein